MKIFFFYFIPCFGHQPVTVGLLWKKTALKWTFDAKVPSGFRCKCCIGVSGLSAYSLSSRLDNKGVLCRHMSYPTTPTLWVRWWRWSVPCSSTCTLAPAHLSIWYLLFICWTVIMYNPRARRTTLNKHQLCYVNTRGSRIRRRQHVRPHTFGLSACFFKMMLKLQ